MSELSQAFNPLIEAIKMEEQVLREVIRVINCPESYVGSEGRYGGCVKFIGSSFLRDYLISLNDGVILIWHQNPLWACRLNFPKWVKFRFSLADPKCFDNLSVEFQRIIRLEKSR